MDKIWLDRLERLQKFSIDSGYEDLDIEFWGKIPSVVVYLIVNLIEENELLKLKKTNKGN
jgi:hypothetical protein